MIRNPSQALRIAKRYRGGILDPDDDRDRKAAVGHLIDFAAMRAILREIGGRLVRNWRREEAVAARKRGMRGIYQWCSEKHLHRYLAEFDFRYCNRAALGVNDSDRADALLRGVIGKRLTYRNSHIGA